MSPAALSVGLALLLFGLVSWSRRRFVVVTVAGDSMLPTLVDGQRVVARRTHGGTGYVHGDIVVFRAPEREWIHEPAEHRAWLVKRVAALPGDPIPVGVQATSARVPPDHVVVLGDNAAHSQDSRQFGPIAQGSIIATWHARS